MASRNCKPDADFVRLWKTLMPGTPMPACGTGKESAPPEKDNAAPAEPPRDTAKRSAD
jgi:hypothetical protein